MTKTYMLLVIRDLVIEESMEASLSRIYMIHSMMMSGWASVANK